MRLYDQLHCTFFSLWNGRRVSRRTVTAMVNITRCAYQRRQQVKIDLIQRHAKIYVSNGKKFEADDTVQHSRWDLDDLPVARNRGPRPFRLK